MNIAEILREKAILSGNKEAILECRKDRFKWLKTEKSANHSVSYSQLYERTLSIAEQFRRHGLTKDDVVLVATSMSSELYAVLLATFQIGATAMFIDIAQGAQHLDRCLSIVKPKAIVASWKFCLATLLTEKTRAIPLKFQLSGGLLPGFKSLCDVSQVDKDGSVGAAQVSSAHPALITFTSGSTGLPKAIVRSHGFLLKQLQVLSTHTSSEDQPDKRELVTLPIFVLANLASGVTSIIPNANLKKPGSFEQRPVLNQLENLQPSRITASPAFLDRLCAFAIAEDLIFPAIKNVFTGGGPVFPKTIDAAVKVFPNANIQTVYGSTEAEPIALTSSRLLTLDDRTKMLNGAGLLVGKPIDEIAVKIIAQPIDVELRGGNSISKERWEELTASSEVAGEILVSGAHVISGYLNGQGDAETKVRVADTIWHRTGDAGYIDRLGRLWLLGRHGNRVGDSAEGRLFPFQVEAVAKAQPGVSAAALIELIGAGANGGTKRILVIECRSVRKGRQKREICSELQGLLSWAHLDDVAVVRKIPMDRRHNSKVVYERLKKQLPFRLGA